MKNQTTRSRRPEEWTIDEIIGLNEGSPSKWSKKLSRASLRNLGEGTAVLIEGYLINAHQAKTPESCNCYLKGQDNNDYHLNLVADSSDKMKDSVVIELTPRFDRDKQGWDLSKLRGLAKERRYVRVTGYLLFDSQHANYQRMPRATAWEIHQVTSFEVCRAHDAKKCSGKKAQWIKLSSYSDSE